MPIDIGTFEKRADTESGDTHAIRITRFLAANEEQAFRRGEIADAVGIDANAVSAVLSRLKERDVVRHGPPYWAIRSERRLVTAADVGRSLEALNERLGTGGTDE